jgi:PhzF family phenazine biosynthesis protein
MKFPIYHVDAFAVQPFRGNPAAVCLLEKPRDPAWMQAVAAEMRLSETAFLSPESDGYSLRWFTPTTEVELCGHATLASAHILYEFGFFEPEETIHFYTASGLITSSFNHGTIELDMPRRDPQPYQSSPLIQDILGMEPATVMEFEGKQLLVELPSQADVEHFVPDFRKISQLEHPDFLITAPGDGVRFDFVSRFFSPRSGIYEDPVTGMAHCILGPYWAARLQKTKFHAYQASARGGEVWVRLGSNRVYLGGKAVTVFAGELLHQRD